MTLCLDGFDMLRRIGANKDRFPALEPKVAALAETIVKAELMSRALDVRAFAALVDALGAEAVNLVIETMKPAERKRLTSSLSGAKGRIKGVSKEAEALLTRMAGNGKAKADAAGRRTHKPHVSPLGTAAMRASRER